MTRARVMTIVALSLAGLWVGLAILGLALAAFGPKPHWEAFSIVGAEPECMMLDSGSVLVQLHLAGSRGADAEIDRIDLVDSQNLQLTGAQLHDGTAYPYAMERPPSGADYARMRPDESEWYGLGPVTKPDNVLVLLLRPSVQSEAGSATAVRLVSVHGEPIYVDDLVLNIVVDSGNCSLSPERD